VRIIDLVFILKDDEGNVTTFEFDQLEELAAFSTLEGEISGLINTEDVAYAADALEPNTSAAILVWEDTWATEFAEQYGMRVGLSSKVLESRPSSLRLPPPISPPTTSSPDKGETVMPLRRTRGLARTVGRTAVIAGTATAVSGHVAHRQAARAQQSQEPAPAAAPAGEPVDVVDQLKRFADLRDQGILTEEEFAAQKAKLLGS